MTQNPEQKPVCHKVYYSNGAIVTFYQLKDGTFKRLVNYTDCPKCNGRLDNSGYVTLKTCDCSYRFYDDMNPENKLNKIRTELQRELRELENDYAKIVRAEKKEIQSQYPELNNKKKSSIHAINRMIDEKYMHSDIARLYRQKLYALWSLSPEDYPIPEITKVEGINLDTWYKVDYAYPYHTQGWGMHKYTVGALSHTLDTIKKMEIEAYIVDTGYQYDLIAAKNITKEELNEFDGMTLSDLCQYYWNRGINPRVYFGELPYTAEYEYGYNKSI